MAVNFPAFAHRVTVLGSTRKSLATSAGVRRISCSVGRCVFISESVLFVRFEGKSIASEHLDYKVLHRLLKNSHFSPSLN